MLPGTIGPPVPMASAVPALWRDHNNRTNPAMAMATPAYTSHCENQNAAGATKHPIATSAAPIFATEFMSANVRGEMRVRATLAERHFRPHG